MTLVGAVTVRSAGEEVFVTCFWLLSENSMKGFWKITAPSVWCMPGSFCYWN